MKFLKKGFETQNSMRCLVDNGLEKVLVRSYIAEKLHVSVRRQLIKLRKRDQSESLKSQISRTNLQL